MNENYSSNEEVINESKLDIKQNNIQQAINKLLPIYNEEEEFPVTTLLTKCYFLSEKLIDAKKIAYDNLNDFLHSLSDFKLLILVLVKNREFIKAREITEQISKISKQWYKISIDIISKEEGFVLENEPAYLQNISNEFYHMSFNNNLYEQKETLLKGEKLPFNKFISYTKYLLLDPFVQETIKSELVDTLRKTNYQDILKIKWIDNDVYSINMGELKSLSQLKTYNNIMSRVDADYANNDPILYLRVKAYFEYQSITLYPLNDQIINNVNDWYKLSIDLYLYGQNNNFNKKSNYYKLISLIINKFSEIS
ncbi:hypothetical protein DY037_04525 [Apilactobacillus micheneri]|uniref:Uncharacterized protein n=1 Tax=Apilactobacillus micheneri TaxID=1899430 RepID=A0ABY2YYM8_9LACO|nr:hypothetical protein [Apilactobacillus micheneri]TPR25700.1 hypothetical protein DY114_03595 [Apilactobacillus micheneri]TPR26804.1 hypothetical protein DY111_03595 [Apilactobacillus micheneri]TPR28592.1 hypothetical protein DY113_01540 [Apilactobacillus micheneri]TPR29279.1 hypothetical protein DY127_06565 [Apilactobacillus micheneri]TPR30867.1 hypothetical protein DY117_03595 [Apilactobacillus micheneri]